MLLSLWFWVILTALDIGIQGYGPSVAHCQPLGLSQVSTTVYWLLLICLWPVLPPVYCTQGKWGRKGWRTNPSLQTVPHVRCLRWPCICPLRVFETWLHQGNRLFSWLCCQTDTVMSFPPGLLLCHDERGICTFEWVGPSFSCPYRPHLPSLLVVVGYGGQVYEQCWKRSQSKKALILKSSRENVVLPLCCRSLSSKFNITRKKL
jgi:hypothetical protein